MFLSSSFRMFTNEHVVMMHGGDSGLACGNAMAHGGQKGRERFLLACGSVPRPLDAFCGGGRVGPVGCLIR